MQINDKYASICKLVNYNITHELFIQNNAQKYKFQEFAFAYKL